MKRSAPLTRKTPLKKRRSKPRKGRAQDSEHLAWIREQRCAFSRHPLTIVSPCEGRVDPHHHTGGRGLGQKASDSRAFPLCRRHHDQFHDGRGVFDGWTKEQRRDWQDRMVDLYKPVDHVF